MDLPKREPTMGRELCVPLAALAMPDESEQMENPEPGDPVSFTGEGKVSRVEGGNAYVRLVSVNGQPIESATAGPMAEPPGDTDYPQLEDEMKGRML